jgi:hypothetical protein
MRTRRFVDLRLRFAFTCAASRAARARGRWELPTEKLRGSQKKRAGRLAGSYCRNAARAYAALLNANGNAYPRGPVVERRFPASHSSRNARCSFLRRVSYVPAGKSPDSSSAAYIGPSRTGVDDVAFARTKCSAAVVSGRGACFVTQSVRRPTSGRSRNACSRCWTTYAAQRSRASRFSGKYVH